DDQLERLHTALVEMGEQVKLVIGNAVQALINQDVPLAQETLLYDTEINAKEKEIEALCIEIILQQQPVAKDLRLVSSVLKMITDLERIGDHASDISEITIYMAGKPYIKKLEHIPLMAAATIKMVTDSIESFVQGDMELARAVIDADDVVDKLFTVIKEELVELIHLNPANGDQAMDLLMIAKYFERIGDHATNVAEWVLFSLTGSHDAYPPETIPQITIVSK
ncbi:MAG: phosphate signaling complex protein PhoU, partial [Symbiobacteriaceae bacterium]|nr:phosphate signaling complex protein PhoU [Symbiobacteriaceae bacterium]